MANIKSNNYRKIDCRIIDDMYFDLMLSKDDVISEDFYTDKVSMSLAFDNVDSKHVISDITWKDAVPSDSILKNIGYTGVDNGFISYQRDRIGNDEFLDLFINSEFDLSTYDTRFFVTEVSGNTSQLTYPIIKSEEYVSLMGGFYQGFFKIEGDKYQTLPNEIENEWIFDITLRKQEYETKSNILNKRHANNNGIFLYIGTRAENKFWELYKKSEKSLEYKFNDSNDYSLDYDFEGTHVLSHQYHEDTPNPENRDDRYNMSCDCNAYFDGDFDPYTESGKKECINNDYFSDDYTGEGTTVGCDCPVNDLAIEDDYIQEQISLEGLELTDSKGYSISESGIYEIKTDNKFITFNRTKDGFTTKTWSDDIEFILTGTTNSPNINYFPYLNRTPTGYTKESIDKLQEEHTYAYNIFKDIENNALAFKINEDGSISYRYLTDNCEILEETSSPNLIHNSQWADIRIKIVRKSNQQIYSKCETSKGKMQLYIYVNGYLKLISKELPGLNLRGINDVPERQEGVPYCLSIGGGTQGLSERIMLNYYDITDYLLPLEKNFGGTFIGDVKNFTLTII